MSEHLSRDGYARFVSQRSLKFRVVAAAEEALGRQRFVTPIDVCLGLGWLQDRNVDDWQRGRVDDLEYFLPVHDDRLTLLLGHLDRWATGHGLQRTEAEYISAARDRRQLRFLAHGCRTRRPHGKPAGCHPTCPNGSWTA